MPVLLPIDHLAELWPDKLRGARIGALLHAADAVLTSWPEILLDTARFWASRVILDLVEGENVESLDALSRAAAEARADAGRRVGAARGRLREALRERQVQLEAERDRQVLITEAVDVTLPGGRTPAGARHPVTSLGDRLSDVFVAMGYEVAEGPEVEAEWYNFDALNMLPDHPARDAQDTIFIQSPAGPEHKSGMVLRTQTSPVQIRSMLTRPLPLYVVSPGKCYRTDTLDVDQGLKLIFAFNHEAAIQSFAHAAELDPDLADVRYRLGQAYVRTGAKDRAQAEFAIYQKLREQHLAELDKQRAEIRQFVYTLRDQSPTQIP